MQEWWINFLPLKFLRSSEKAVLTNEIKKMNNRVLSAGNEVANETASFSNNLPFVSYFF